jgi:hypothetical protein
MSLPAAGAGSRRHLTTRDAAWASYTCIAYHLGTAIRADTFCVPDSCCCAAQDNGIRLRSFGGPRLHGNSCTKDATGVCSRPEFCLQSAADAALQAANEVWCKFINPQGSTCQLLQAS